MTNFNKYVEIFAEKFNVPILGKDANMIMAALGLPIPKLMMVIPSALADIMLAAPLHKA